MNKSSMGKLLIVFACLVAILFSAGIGLWGMASTFINYPEWSAYIPLAIAVGCGFGAAAVIAIIGAYHRKYGGDAK